MTFSAWQVYVPTSEDCRFIIVSELSITLLLVLVVLISIAFDVFIMLPLKYQLIFGSGSPVALQVNVIGFVPLSITSVISVVISGGTKHKYLQCKIHTYVVHLIMQLTLYSNTDAMVITSNTIVS